MVEQAAVLYITVITSIFSLLTGVAIYAMKLSDNNDPRVAEHDRRKYKGLGFVTGVLAVWGILILLS